MKNIKKLTTPPVFISRATVVGKEEREGPMGSLFDHCDPTGSFGRRTQETAEAEMERLALNTALTKAGISHGELELIVAGDLQNQCLASNRGLASFGAPYLGIYGACSTCTESLLILSQMISSGSVRLGAAVTGSHNAVAERQFRAPLEYGALRAPSAQWTATAAGAFILADMEDPAATRREEKNPFLAAVTEYTVGRLVDSSSVDPANMGGAMAFAAYDTLKRYFSEEGHSPTDHDLILTGDLGEVGHAMLCHLMEKDHPGCSGRLADCGLMLYDKSTQDVHAGGSGCGCSAAVLAASVLPRVERGELKDLLLLSTGALTSMASVRQGSSIIGIAPLIRIQAVRSPCRGADTMQGE